MDKFEEKSFKCIESFAIGEYDEHEELVENKHYEVPKGSEWYIIEHNYSSDIRLESEFGWIEITKEMLEEFFVEIKE